MVNRGLFMTPGDEEQWTLSVQHTEADIDRYVDAFAELCASEARTVGERVEATSWDGAWYRRAYYDDGTPIGSRQSKECRIDAIAQSWSDRELALARVG